jgi:AcrR family transcriptional regulator
VIENGVTTPASSARRAVDPDSDRVAATRAELLDAAETLFLEQGYEAVSIRTINAAAARNPGAAHYHFGSKRGLVAALLESRLLPMWEADVRGRFAELAVADDVSIHDVVGLSVDPLFALCAKPGPGRLYVRLLAMVVLGRWDVTWRSESFSVDRWMELVARAAPDVPADILRGRWELAIALMLEQIGRPLDDDVDAPVDVGRDELVAFLAAAITAPLPERRGATRAGAARARGTTTRRTDGRRRAT